MRICFWATSFQADNQALASHLSQQPGTEVLVALDCPETYQRDAVWELLPLRARLIDRRARAALRHIEDFGPDCVIVDNHLPKQPLAQCLYVLWHGYGWRVDDLSTMKRELHKLVGDVQRPNPRFRWHAFGAQDWSYRTRHSGFAEQNVISLGSAYSDLLSPESSSAVQLDLRSVQRHYSIDLSRPTVLLGMTWHHGGALSHWGDDQVLHEELAITVGAAGANLLIRMHDRHRYHARDVARMEALAARHPHVQLKFKDTAPDSLVDLLVSAVMISNYSSFLNAFYHTGKPSIHIDPTVHGSGPNYRRDLRWGRIWTRRVSEPMASWKLSPEDVGGLVARNFSELSSAIRQSLAEPNCCRELAGDFVRRHITQPDGHTCARITTYLRDWLQR